MYYIFIQYQNETKILKSKIKQLKEDMSQTNEGNKSNPPSARKVLINY